MSEEVKMRSLKLTDLPPEIFPLVPLERRDMASMALVCKRMGEIFRPLLYKSVVLEEVISYEMKIVPANGNGNGNANWDWNWPGNGNANWIGNANVNWNGNGNANANADADANVNADGIMNANANANANATIHSFRFEPSDAMFVTKRSYELLKVIFFLNDGRARKIQRLEIQSLDPYKMTRTRWRGRGRGEPQQGWQYHQQQGTEPQGNNVVVEEERYKLGNKMSVLTTVDLMLGRHEFSAYLLHALSGLEHLHMPGRWIDSVREGLSPWPMHLPRLKTVVISGAVQGDSLTLGVVANSLSNLLKQPMLTSCRVRFPRRDDDEPKHDRLYRPFYGPAKRPMPEPPRFGVGVGRTPGPQEEDVGVVVVDPHTRPGVTVELVNGVSMSDQSLTKMLAVVQGDLTTFIWITGGHHRYHAAAAAAGGGGGGGGGAGAGTGDEAEAENDGINFVGQWFRGHFDAAFSAVSGSLVNLVLLHDGTDTGGWRDPVFADLLFLHHLRDLRIEATLLLGHWDLQGWRTGYTFFPPHRARHPSSLASLLPASLERLGLALCQEEVSGSDCYVQLIVEGFVKVKQGKGRDLNSYRQQQQHQQQHQHLPDLQQEQDHQLQSNQNQTDNHHSNQTNNQNQNQNQTDNHNGNHPRTRTRHRLPLLTQLILRESEWQHGCAVKGYHPSFIAEDVDLEAGVDEGFDYLLDQQVSTAEIRKMQKSCAAVGLDLTYIKYGGGSHSWQGNSWDERIYHPHPRPRPHTHTDPHPHPQPLYHTMTVDEKSKDKDTNTDNHTDDSEPVASNLWESASTEQHDWYRFKSMHGPKRY